MKINLNREELEFLILSGNLYYKKVLNNWETPLHVKQKTLDLIQKLERTNIQENTLDLDCNSPVLLN